MRAEHKEVDTAPRGCLAPERPSGMTGLSGTAGTHAVGSSIADVGRNARAAGVAALVIGAVVVAAALHSILTFHAPAGSTQTVTLGQVASLLVGAALLAVAAVILGTDVRRRLEVRRRRRLTRRLAARLDQPD